MGARILVIEDDAASLELVRYLLAAAGHTVLLAHHGAEGLESARAARPDLIVTDLHMPGMDGMTLLRHLRQDPALAATPVVAVTAYSMVSDRNAVFAAGFSGYVSKPIDPDNFVRTIESHLPAAPDAPGD